MKMEQYREKKGFEGPLIKRLVTQTLSDRSERGPYSHEFPEMPLCPVHAARQATALMPDFPRCRPSYRKFLKEYGNHFQHVRYAARGGQRLVVRFKGCQCISLVDLLTGLETFLGASGSTEPACCGYERGREAVRAASVHEVYDIPETSFSHYAPRLSPEPPAILHFPSIVADTARCHVASRYTDATAVVHACRPWNLARTPAVRLRAVRLMQDRSKRNM
ncbi:hypothetical protein BDW68DRAFT_172248 [Aspergillus falconensis]